MKSIGRLVFFCLALGDILTLRAAESSLETGSDVEQSILSAYQAGKKVVTLPPGLYRLPEPASGAYLSFHDLKDFRIEAPGVTFLRTQNTRDGIRFRNCQGVTFHGATLINETPPFTQGTVVAIDPANHWYDVRIDAGYPANFDDPKTGVSDPVGYVFDPQTRQWKTGAIDCFFGSVQRLSPNKFRLFFKEPIPPGSNAAVVGDLMAFRGRGSVDIEVEGCAKMALSDLTLKNCGGFCVHESGGEGDNHYSYHVTYGPAPAGATTTPLIASDADAFHSSDVRHGPTLENCLFEGMCDDGVPIHGTFALVVGSQGNQVTLALSGGNFFRAQDPIRFMDAQGSYVGDTTLQQVVELPGNPVGAPITNPRFTGSHRFVELTLAQSLPLGFQYLASDPAACGSGYVIRHNIIRNHRARGLLLKADHGLVEDNLIEGSTIAAIVITPEIWWNEAGFSHDLIIRHNHIRHVGYSTIGSSDHQSGALTITGGGVGEADHVSAVYQSKDPGQILVPGHENIVIADNIFEDCDGTNLMICQAKKVTVSANQFINAQQQPSRRGVPSGADPTALIWLNQCTGIDFKDNVVTNLGPANKILIKRNAAVTDVTGLTDGVRLQSK